MDPRIVIGANFGDEGKGLMTDYLCREIDAEVVCRFNGGAQAGHTVVLPNGTRHVFQHLGAGAFTGATTFLSETFIVNPVRFHPEFEAFTKLHHEPAVFVDPAAIVTTPYDMVLNQAMELQRGGARHGSVGMGINETVVRQRTHPLIVADLTRVDAELRERLFAIITEYVPARLDTLQVADSMRNWLAPYLQSSTLLERFIEDCKLFLKRVGSSEPYEILHGEHVVFEGAQGLALDQNNADEFPNVTRSNTGIRNAMHLITAADLPKPIVTYVTRSYLTRHGAGRLDHELPESETVQLRDSTNLPHDFQGVMRYGPLDVQAMERRIAKDLLPFMDRVKTYNAAVTWCDQLPVPMLDSPIRYASYGPTHQDVRLHLPT